MLPEKRYSDGAEGATSVPPEEGLVFEPDFSSKEHERVLHYRTKLVFKDGEFVVRIPFTSYPGSY